MSRKQPLLPRNEGTVDRMIRVALGVTLLALVFAGPRSTWGLLGLFPLATGLSGFCPMYTVFGISTAGRRNGKDEDAARSRIVRTRDDPRDREHVSAPS